jgi:ribosomal protein L13E
MSHGGIGRHVLMTVGRCRSRREGSLRTALRRPRMVVTGGRLHLVVRVGMKVESGWQRGYRCGRLQAVGLVQAQASPRA